MTLQTAQYAVLIGTVNQPVMFKIAHDPGRTQSACESNGIDRGLRFSSIIAAQYPGSGVLTYPFRFGRLLTIIQE
jgi:hypothetical protein